MPKCLTRSWRQSCLQRQHPLFIPSPSLSTLTWLPCSPEQTTECPRVELTAAAAARLNPSCRVFPFICSSDIYQALSMCQNVCLWTMQGWEVSCLEREPGMAAPLGAAVVRASWGLSPALGPSLGDCCLP